MLWPRPWHPSLELDYLSIETIAAFRINLAFVP
jgi:hypothetical protein